jgi:O-antigen/teichoic acid export membrane protein
MNDAENVESTQRPSWRPDSFATSVIVLLAVTAVQRTVGFGRGILFCRWLSPEELGEWDMAYGFLLLASPLVVLGLPGSFGRYLERYRQRNQLRTFLYRASVWTGLLTAAAVGLLLAATNEFSQLIFGHDDERGLMPLVAISLAAVILHHFLEALYAALRKYRIVSTMHFCQSLTFAGVSLALLVWWRSAVESVIVGYGLACLISSIGALAWTRRDLVAVAVRGDVPSHASFWPPLVRFAIWVWVTNLLCHLFAILDRYMLVHYSGLDNATALAQVGNYHASRIVPLLFLSVADLLAGVVLPYLSHDWESGNKERVAQRVNLVLKFSSFTMLAGGAVVLIASPLLFEYAFHGRYDEGLAVMPATLTYCTWYGLLLIGQTYLWCAERMKSGTLPLLAGLVVNFLLNLAMIPAWGLSGAVISTTISTGIALVVLFVINHRFGMPVNTGVLLFSLAPVALCGGPWASVVTFCAILFAMPWSRTLVAENERGLFRNALDRYCEPLRRLFPAHKGRPAQQELT